MAKSGKGPAPQAAAPALPWSRKIAALQVARRGIDLTLEADDETRQRIISALELETLESLTAKVHIKPSSGDIVTVTGEIHAKGQQRCVVSLVPVPFALTETIEQRYASDEVLPKPTKAEIERSLDDPDPPEPLDEGMIDIAALVVETLGLALDPYPRAAGAIEMAQSVGADTADDQRDNPFAALAVLKLKN